MAAREFIKLTPKIAEGIEKCDFNSGERRYINNIYIYIFAFKNSDLPLQSRHNKLYRE